ncbi:MAG: O-antigen ligase family protein [Terracidiphilus sp.]|jgi:O-antigen ligase
MGFVLSVLYLITNYVTPAVLFGPLAVARIELILAILLLIISLPQLTRSFILKTPQSLALIGLAIATSLSVLSAVRWAGGAVQAFLGFIPNAFAYFLVCLHCTSKKKLQIIVLMLLFVCLFVIANGYSDLIHGVSQGSPGATESTSLIYWGMEHPYLLAMKNETGEMIYRLRGRGLINDPNDFGQLIVCLIPLLFVFWRAKKRLWNIGIVILPVSALLFGVFLTHSRGALLALMAIMVVAGRRRIGTLPALLIAVGVFAAAMALNFTGGRDISVDAGTDRTALWSSGLQMLKSHPFFGVGMGSFIDNCGDCGHTAHNSLVVCAAELGLVGLFFWAMFLFTSVRDALVIASPAKVQDVEPNITEEERPSRKIGKNKAIDKTDVNRLGRLLVLSLTGFLVAGWFLSRAYVMTFFLLGGMVEVIYEMALRQGMIAPRLRVVRLLSYTGGFAVLLVLLMYILLLTVNLMH